MQDRATTSWRRRSDGASRPEAQPSETVRIAGAGGKTAVSEPMARVLIVDNDMLAADSLELMLHGLGYPQTRVAYSGHAALAIASVFKPGVVMVELDLLDMDGYELGPRLRERTHGLAPRLIALTSSREHRHRELARSAGFERYLLKPVVAIGLLEVLELPSR